MEIGFGMTKEKEGSVAEAWAELTHFLDMLITLVQKNDQALKDLREFPSINIETPEHKISEDFRAKISLLSTLAGCSATCEPMYYIIGFSDTVEARGSIDDAWLQLHRDLQAILETARNNIFYLKMINQCYGGVIVHIPQQEIDATLKAMIEQLRRLIKHPLTIKCTQYNGPDKHVLL